MQMTGLFCILTRSIFYEDSILIEIRSLYSYLVQVIGIRPLAPVQNSVSLKLMQCKTLNFVINLLDVENLTK